MRVKLKESESEQSSPSWFSSRSKLRSSPLQRSSGRKRSCQSRCGAPLIRRDGLIACNGVELAAKDFPDLFTIFGHTPRGLRNKGSRLADYALVPNITKDFMWYVAPRVADEWPSCVRRTAIPPNRRTSKRCMRSAVSFAETETFPKYKTISVNFERD